jgi:hypothetical protein
MKDSKNKVSIRWGGKKYVAKWEKHFDGIQEYWLAVFSKLGITVNFYPEKSKNCRYRYIVECSAEENNRVIYYVSGSGRSVNDACNKMKKVIARDYKTIKEILKILKK